jgi:hypothetical protein
MSVMHSALAHELSPSHARPVAAIVYANEVYPDALFKCLVQRCRALGLSLAGVLQHQAFEGAARVGRAPALPVHGRKDLHRLPQGYRP